jgi:hypothetical protein
MVILRAIGNFFVRIGRWIKNTAWIQPLLIVGGIFGIIFAIPHITNWVKSWVKETSAAETYYKNKQIKLDGAEDGTSEFDKLLENLETFNTDAIKSKYGEKFFLTFVQEGCMDCEDRYGGFKYLENNWGKNEFDLDGTFKLHTVFIDSENKEGDNLFKELYKRDTITKIFEETTEVLQDQNTHPYALNCSVGSTSYKASLEKINDPDNFFSPTTLLIDLTDDADAPAWISEYGISEVLFSFEGDSDVSYARTLRDAWSCEGVFSPEYKK